jgi:hypothetical protein
MTQLASTTSRCNLTSRTGKPTYRSDDLRRADLPRSIDDFSALVASLLCFMRLNAKPIPAGVAEVNGVGAIIGRGQE